MSDKTGNVSDNKETDVSACEDKAVGEKAEQDSKVAGADDGMTAADAAETGEASSADAVDADAGDAVNSATSSPTDEPEQQGEECVEKSSSDLGAQLAEMQDKYLRLQAEWDNFRKRTATEREQERSRANERLVSNLLQVVDDMERAIAGFVGKDDDPMLAGIKAVYSKFVDVLTREGLKAIDPQRGDAFDIHNHQAVSKVEDTSMPDDSIVEVYQKGYIMGEKNLRPAMVVVSSGGPKRED